MQGPRLFAAVAQAMLMRGRSPQDVADVRQLEPVAGYLCVLENQDAVLEWQFLQAGRCNRGQEGVLAIHHADGASTVLFDRRRNDTRPEMKNNCSVWENFE